MTTAPSPTPPAPSTNSSWRDRALRERPVAMRLKPAGGQWTPISFQQLLEQRPSVSLGLANSACGAATAWRSCRRTGRNGRSPTTPAWRCALRRRPDLPHAARHQIEYILRDSGARWRSASSQAQLDKLLEIRGDCRRSARHRVRRPRRTGRTCSRFEGARGAGRALPVEPGWRADALTVAAGRPGHAHLHLGHHRRAQGRDADPRQHHLERARGPAAHARSGARRSTSASPSCRCPTSSSGWPGTTS